MRARLWLAIGATVALCLATPAATLGIYGATSEGQYRPAAGSALMAGFRSLRGAAPGQVRQPQSQISSGVLQITGYRSEGSLTQGPLFYTTAAGGQTYDGAGAGTLPTGAWAPGDSYTRTLVVRNTGSLDALLTGVGAALQPGSSRYLANQLIARVSTDPTGNNVLASGTLGQFIDGPQTFSSNLALPLGGSPATFYFTVALPLTADNSYQNLTLRLDFIVTAQQPPICSVNDLAFQRSYFTNSSLTPSGAAMINGDVFVNGDLSTKGSARVTGTGWATGSVSGQVGTPQPNQPPIAFPAVNWASLRGRAQQAPNRYVSGDLELSGSYTFAQPTIYYVDGDLKLAGSDVATITGRVIFVVGGEVHISGNAAVLEPANSASAISIWGKGDVTLSGSARVNALIYSQEELEVTGSAVLNGLAVTGQLETSGSARLNAQTAQYACPALGG